MRVWNGREMVIKFWGSWIKKEYVLDVLSVNKVVKSSIYLWCSVFEEGGWNNCVFCF